VTVQSLTGSAVLSRNQWTATVVVTVVNGAGAAVAGAEVSGTWSTPNGSGSCVTSAAGTCAVDSGNLNAKKVASTTYAVTGVVRGADAYVPGATSVTIQRP
jgi:hypothetical protein